MTSACVIMHNMFVKDEGEEAVNVDFVGGTGPPETCTSLPEVWNKCLNNHVNYEMPEDQEYNITCEATYFVLQHNLVEHLWARHGSRASRS